MTEVPKPRPPKAASAPKADSAKKTASAQKSSIRPKKQTTKVTPQPRQKDIPQPKHLTNRAFSENAELKALRDQLLLGKDNEEN